MAGETGGRNRAGETGDGETGDTAKPGTDHGSLGRNLETVVCPRFSSILAVEREGQAPVPANPNGPMSRQVARKWVQPPAARAVGWAVGSGWAAGSSNRALPNRRCVSRVTGVRIFPFSSQDWGEGKRKDLKIPLFSSCGCVTSASAATAAGPGACRRFAPPWRPRRPSCRTQPDPSGYPCPRCRQGQRRVTARPPPTAMTRGARPARRSDRR